MLSDDDHRRITEAVRNAEARTCVEFVPVVAAASGRYDRGEDIVGLWVGGAAMVATWYLAPATIGDGWGQGWAWQPWIQLAALVLGFVLGAALASRTFWLRRWFTSAAEQRDEVLQRARTCFFDARVHHTAGASGLLVYVSLGEHRAVVLGDQAVVAAVGQATIEEWCRLLTSEIPQLGVAAAIATAIERAAETLHPALPRSGEDRNELDDAVRELAAP